ncbi:MAG TPA: hypothetical protein VFC19_49065 [Candidatus Limnocylindrales bacterium]|nr:hypothetical protein [Candidatus Limnocylindrales bacterium]
MDERTRWDIQLWFASLIAAAFAAFAAFLAIQQVSRYNHFAGINWSRQQLLGEALGAEGWPHWVARVVTLIVVVVATLPGLLYLHDRSLLLNKRVGAMMTFMVSLAFMVSKFVHLTMPSLDVRCACGLLRDLKVDAMWSISEVVLAVTAIVYLWVLRFYVHGLLATDPDEA